MTTKTKQYAHQCLASAGFAIMAPTFAWQLRPDLWASPQDCGVSFASGITAEGAKRLLARFADGTQAPILTRSLDMLEKRIEWVAGQKVVSLSEPKQPEQGRVIRAPSDVERQAESKRANLRDLAAQELPAHDCALRKDILAARSELGLKAA